MSKRILALATLALLCLCAEGAVVFKNGLKTVATAGTAVPLAAVSTTAKWATIQALSTNTGTVCFGGAPVASTRSGTCLTAGLAAPLNEYPGQTYDLGTILLDSTVSGEGASYTYVY